MNSNVSSSPASSRKRRAVAGSLVSSLELTTTPHRATELHGEASVLGSATSMSCDTAISSQQRCTSTDSSPSFKLLQSEYPISPGTPQKNFLLPVATTRKARRWRSQRCCNARALILMLAALSLLVMCWVAHTGSEVAPYDTPLRQERAKGGKEAHRGSVFSTTKVPKAAKSAKSPAHTSTTAKAASTTTTTGKPTTTTEENLLTEHPMSTSTITVEDSLTANNTVEDSLAANITVDDSLTANTTVEDSLTANITVEDSTNVTTSAKELEFVEADANRSTWAVLVQHEDAAMRRASAGSSPCVGSAASPCPAQFVDALSLPSWTLHAIPPTCETCPDPGLYAAATRNVSLSDHHGVFASVLGPLGRVGPMLFAMSSVTNEVPVREELAKWTWLRHVYPALSAKLDGAKDNGNGNGDAPRASYLAVMGVPSTDQPARVALRDAQRATWLTYQEVARTENDFTGALLPLYLFAAVEPSPEIPASAEVQEDGTANTSVTEMPNGDAEVDTPEEGEDTPRTATTTTSTTTTTSAPRPGAHLCGHTDALLPTVRDYHVASHVWARRNGRNAEDVPADAAGDKAEGYVQRRVVLRSDYLTSDLSVSPCRGVAETRVTASSVSTLPLYHLSQSMGMNVTPAFVAAAEYICCASAGLWGEALAHRNVLWLDMMTDRRPTTKKKLGDTSKWGLPVEVGMSQKLILWLMYAYNSFTEVPYIIKGDDDMYLKVPQFLNDMRLLRRGARHGRLPPPPLQALTTPNGAVVPYADPDAPYNMTATECVYWGSTRRMRGVLFNAGMLFLLQRKLVGVVLERPHNSSDVDLLELASKNYSRKLLSVYKRASFDKEDVLMGVTLLNRQKRAEEVCARHRVWYGRESRTRFHDMRKGRTNPVTWATVVAHRCRPADAYLLHYFFTHELGVAQADVAPGESREEMAREAAATWAAETRRELGDDVTDWDALPEVKWMPSGSTRPSHWMAENDKVPVYNVSYFSWKDERAGVKDGYKTLA